MKRIVIVVAATCAVGLSGAVASVLASSPTPSAEISPPMDEQGQSERHGPEKEHERSGAADAVHGGSVERFEASASCTLIDVSALPGNWTHGDYVSAVAADSDASLVSEAAHSECGKPIQAGGKGGPPAHSHPVGS